jgi:hypothetical protein
MFSARKPDYDAQGGYPKILAGLGLTQERFREALAVRRYDRRSARLPGSFAGSIPSAEAKASLARSLGAITEEVFKLLNEVEAEAALWLDDGWRIKTVSESGIYAFSLKVWVGDNETGNRAGDPRPRNSKGPETREDVRSNSSQRGLFDNLPEEVRNRILELRSEQDDGRLFVVLLFRYEFTEDQCCHIHWELSVPGTYDESAQTVSHWLHREIFPDFVVDLSDDGETYESGTDSDPQVDRD